MVLVSGVSVVLMLSMRSLTGNGKPSYGLKVAFW